MSSEIKITGRLIAAARALVGVGESDFAEAAGLPVDVFRLLESQGSAWIQSERDVEAMSRALAFFGVIVIDESDGRGAGVRLKFTREDVMQIGRLENEGGMIASDDQP
jgi:hypothetical protein